MAFGYESQHIDPRKVVYMAEYSTGRTYTIRPVLRPDMDCIDYQLDAVGPGVRAYMLFRESSWSLYQSAGDPRPQKLHQIIDALTTYGSGILDPGCGELRLVSACYNGHTLFQHAQSSACYRAFVPPPDSWDLDRFDINLATLQPTA